MGWEALPRELKSVPPFLNNGPGPSLALLHPAPPRLPPPLVGCWGHLSWKPRSRGGRGQRRPAADKVPSLWAPLAAQAPGDRPFCGRGRGQAASPAPHARPPVSFFFKARRPDTPTLSPLSSSCGHLLPQPPAHPPPRPVWPAVSSPDHQLAGELSEFRRVPQMPRARRGNRGRASSVAFPQGPTA